MSPDATLSYAGHYQLPVRAAEALPAAGAKPWDGDGFGFSDLVDIINPLQHLPVVSTVYRASTDDDLGGIPRLLGGLLFGGPWGLLFSAVNLAIQAISGRDVGEHVTAAFLGNGGETVGEEGRMLAWWPEPSEDVASSAVAGRQAYREVARFVLDPPEAERLTMTA